MKIFLRDVIDSDLPIFFEHLNDPATFHMVAFIPPERKDWEQFQAHWNKIRSDDSVITQSIIYGDEIAGHMLFFEREGRMEVGYLIGRGHWGKGIGTRSLELFLEQIPDRPLYAHTAKENKGSIRILEKCGFYRMEELRSYAAGRDREIDGLSFKLE